LEIPLFGSFERHVSNATFINNFTTLASLRLQSLKKKKLNNCTSLQNTIYSISHIGYAIYGKVKEYAEEPFLGMPSYTKIAKRKSQETIGQIKIGLLRPKEWSFIAFLLI